MALEKEYVLIVESLKSVLSEQMFISKHDKGLDILFKIIDSPSLKLSKHKYVYSDVVLVDIFNNEIVSDITPVVENRVLFTINESIMSQMKEYGKYDVHIRLFDDRGRGTKLPPFSITYEETIVSEKLLQTADVDNSSIDNSKIFRIGADIPVSNSDGTYNRTVWVAGDIITDSKMNKIEEAIYNIINRLIEDENKLKELDKSKGYIIKVGTYDYPVIIEDLQKGTYLIEGYIQNFYDEVPVLLEGKNYLYVTYASDNYLKVARCFDTEETFKLYKYDKTLNKIILLDEDLYIVTPEENVLTLSENENQIATLSETTTIVLPSLQEYRKITLYLNVLSNTTLVFPNVTWKQEPVLNNDGMIEIEFTYINDTWYAKVNIYE